MAGTHPSDLNVAVYNPATDGGPGPPLATKIAHLALVKRVKNLVTPTFIPLTAHGAPRLSTLNLVVTLGSLDGELFNQDRITATVGQLADPQRADEIMMTASAARLLGVHVGQVVPMGFYLHAQQPAGVRHAPCATSTTSERHVGGDSDPQQPSGPR